MELIGYYRCSLQAMNEERQILALKEAKCSKIYGDKITGTSKYGDRKELSRCLEELREGQCLVIGELSRLGRNLLEMMIQVNQLLDRGCHLMTLDNRLNTTTMSPEIVKLIVAVMGYCSEIELQTLRTRCEEGRQVALKNGTKFGAKRKYTKEQASTVVEMREQGKGYGTIAKSMGFSIGKVRRILDLNKEPVGIGVVA
tara:strand:- start:4585 stop:5181 length:597 start_codon:yes stop_codon:yes gene_type:complete